MSPVIERFRFFARSPGGVPTGLLLLLTLVGGVVPASGQAPVQYHIAFPNVAQHEAEIQVRFQDVPAGPLQVRMSRTSPGRYALHEFAKNVYSVRVEDGNGDPLEAERPNLHQWDVSGHDGTVVVRYTLFGDRADGTYAGIDRTHGHLNMPATFMWARGMEDRPIELSVEPPAGSNWRVATQLMATRDPYRFTAPDLSYFLDSPTEVSDFELREWDVEGQNVRLVVHHEGTSREVDRYQEMAAEVVRQSIEVFGELPDLDGGEYTFLACYLPWVNGDGMEHRNSTVLTSQGSLERNALGLLGTVAHEFFHTWNVERIRPATLEPFDFENANVSDVLWFAEGFTSYYDDLILWRGGFIDDASFAARLGSSIDQVVNGPGRGYFSPAEMSEQAAFVDAAASIDPDNRRNTFISYYTWGAALGLALDMELRRRFDDRTLDDLMQAMWIEFGRPFRPYQLRDIRDRLAAVTGDDRFAREFFAKYVLGREAPDYPTLLASAGFLVRPANPDGVFIGAPGLDYQEGGAVLQGMPLEGSALYTAGISRGDRIDSVGGRAVGSAREFAAAVDRLRPGQSVEFTFYSRGARSRSTVELSRDPRLEVVVSERSGGTIGAPERAFRDNWRRAR